MTEAALKTDVQNIVVSEILPHSPQVIWRALTDGDMMARWLMPPKGFAPVAGQRFTFQTTPAGAWDGTIACKVLEVVANERLSFSWSGGDAANLGYGSKLDTIVTFSLTPAEGGTRLLLVHSGFELPRNDTAFHNMSRGWTRLMGRLEEIVGGDET